LKGGLAAGGGLRLRPTDIGFARLTSASPGAWPSSRSPAKIRGLMVAFYSLTRALLWMVIVVGAIVGVLRFTVMRWVRLPSARSDPVFGASVAPNLNGGDLVLTWRVGEPGFGDLVLCPEPGAPERIVVGRILGLAGDVVRFEDSTPFTNGRSQPQEQACNPAVFEVTAPDGVTLVKQPCSVEKIGSILHPTGLPGMNPVRGVTRQYTVPQGTVFLVSDNRLFPYDSRQYGYVPAETCSERVFGRVVSARGWTDVDRRLSYIQ
jgi:signal peptidase I